MVATLERPPVVDIEVTASPSMKSERRAPYWQQQISQIMGNGTPSSELQGVNVRSSSVVRKPLGSLRAGASGWQAQYAALMGFQSARMQEITPGSCERGQE